MILVPFEGRHAQTILSGQVNDERIRPPFQISQFVENMVVSDMSFTGLVNGTVVGCGGIYPVWEGVGEAWFLGSHLVHKHKAAVTRAVRQHLVGIMEEHNLHRVQAHVMEDWPGARRWIKFLGMEEEGVLRKFSPEGINYISFARVA